MKLSSDTLVARTLGIAFVIALAVVNTGAQPAPEADFKKVADAFAAAWGKGDAKALAALHAADAVRITAGEQAVVGQAAIETGLASALSGPYKGTTLVITQNKYSRISPDTYVGDGTYEVKGGTPAAGVPTRGQYLNTMVRQQGRWVIAASAVMPAMPPK